MNWRTIIAAAVVGLLFGVYQASSLIQVAADAPTHWEWIKILASGAGAFVIGVFTFMADPNGIWKRGPGVGSRTEA